MSAIRTLTLLLSVLCVARAQSDWSFGSVFSPGLLENDDSPLEKHEFFDEDFFEEFHKDDDDDKDKDDGCFCTEQYSPVCGFDVKTYGNACKAECKGVKIKCHDECPCGSEEPCACSAFYDPVCGADGEDYDNEGCAKCAKTHVECRGKCPCHKGCICTKQYDPVCGEDHTTYGNECEADCAGVAVSCKGECPCKKPCVGPVVRCFKDPCDGAVCPAFPHAKCVANYCGGCNADFYVGKTRVDCSLKCLKEGDVCGGNGHLSQALSCCHDMECCPPCTPIEILDSPPKKHTCQAHCPLCKG